MSQSTKLSGPILVTAAGGRVGGVSTAIVQLLLEKGFPVRALVRTDDKRAESLRKQGAEVVVGDMTNLLDMHRAIKGCSRIYFSMAVSSNFLEASLNVTAVAKHYGVEAFVNMSQWLTALMDINHSFPSPQTRAHWLGEQALKWSGLPVVNLQPHVFLENPFLTSWTSDALINHGELRVPFGDSILPPIAAHDIALAAVAILENPAPHIGKEYVLTGEKYQTMDEIAAAFAAGLGRPVRYVPPSLEEFKHSPFITNLKDQQGADHLLALAKFLHEKSLMSAMAKEARNDLPALIGQAPMGVEEWVRKNKDVYYAARK